MHKPIGVRNVDEEIAGLEPFAKELVRLARDVTQEIDRDRLTPRCLSGLTAMKPLIGLIQGTALKIFRKMLVACIAVQTVMLAYTVTRSAERHGTTIVILTSREGGPERGASCPRPRDHMVSFKVNPQPLN